MLGRTALLTAAAVLRRCGLFGGNDPGLTRIAAAAGAPTLGRFGPSPVEQYAPWGASTAVVRTALPPDELYGPGYDHRTTDTLMDSLSLDMVEATARQLRPRAAAEPAIARAAQTPSSPAMPRTPDPRDSRPR